MAIILQTQLTLNPGNQIAHLADMTGLTPFMEYYITAQYLQNNTRFVFQGNLDITLTLPPVGVPANNTQVPAQIEDIQAPAPVPPPSTYPYAVKDRLQAHYLNLDLENAPAPTPPHNANSTANLGRLWLDTSLTPPALRVCAVPHASATYVANEWFLLGQVGQGAVAGQGVYLPLTGGGTITGNLTVTGNLSVSGSSVITAPSATVGTLTVTGATALQAATAATPATSDNSTHVATTAYVQAQGYATTAGVAAGYLPLSGGNISGSVVAGGNVIGNNSVQSSGVYFQNNSGYFYTPQSFLSSGNVVAQASLYCGGTGGVRWYDSGGAMQTDSYCHVGDFYSAGNVNTSGGIIFAGIEWSNNGGWAYTGSGVQCGNIQNNGNSQVNGNINCNNQINSNVMVANGITSNGNINVAGAGFFGGGNYIQVEGDVIMPFADDWGAVGTGGRLFVAVEAYSIYQASDPRRKKDIAPAPPGALAKVLATPVINYRKKSEADDAPLRTGFDATQVQTQFGGAMVKVGDDENKSLSLSLGDVIAALWQAVQELDAKVGGK